MDDGSFLRSGYDFWEYGIGSVLHLINAYGIN
jgi:hypothetical protein